MQGKEEEGMEGKGRKEKETEGMVEKILTRYGRKTE